ncbi:MAG: aminotransferase class I/II-fold pyridoxal phosphate-dependent enzyme [Oscillospiraceae bacterium]|nr:aminotransferase class I/II-fold pyridoxal phosphate-dependent enzyme [Oscillospiraceae bacterium]
MDLTEIKGADSLYEAEGIIRRSEENASLLFGTGRTLYSTEGSSQCIRAMVYLALAIRKPGTAPVFLAARNVHKAFVYAAALNDAQVIWMQGAERDSLCTCVIKPEQLEEKLRTMDEMPAGVYVTSPDYLGTQADIRGLAEVCHKYGILLLVDNAHGAYLHFLPVPCHPIDLGADICCDSAHKTLPVLTGGAYLHLSARLAGMGELARTAMAMFGSTSPSYLVLASLDCCNQVLSSNYSAVLEKFICKVDAVKEKLKVNGWQLENSDPLRITLTAPDHSSGEEMAEMLRKCNAECEHADYRNLVLMLTPHNTKNDLERVVEALGINDKPYSKPASLNFAVGEQAVSIRQAVFSPYRMAAVENAVGLICAQPTVSCPPAIPVVIPGERITDSAAAVMKQYGIHTVAVIQE